MFWKLTYKNLGKVLQFWQPAEKSWSIATLYFSISELPQPLPLFSSSFPPSHTIHLGRWRQKAAPFIPDLLLATPHTAAKHQVWQMCPKGCRNWDFTCEYTPSGKCTQDPHVLPHKYQSLQQWCHLHCSFWRVCPSAGTSCLPPSCPAPAVHPSVSQLSLWGFNLLLLTEQEVSIDLFSLLSKSEWLS